MASPWCRADRWPRWWRAGAGPRGQGGDHVRPAARRVRPPSTCWGWTPHPSAGPTEGWTPSAPGACRGGWSGWSRPWPAGRDRTCRATAARPAARASQFIHIGPDETATLARMPAALLFPAPGLPRRSRAHGLRRARPLPDAGRRSVLDLRGSARAPVAPTTAVCSRRRGWSPTGWARSRSSIAFGAGGSTRRRPKRFTATTPCGRRRGTWRTTPRCSRQGPPVSATQLAVLAVELHELFLGGEPDPGSVRVEIARRRQR